MQWHEPSMDTSSGPLKCKSPANDVALILQLRIRESAIKWQVKIGISLSSPILTITYPQGKKKAIWGWEQVKEVVHIGAQRWHKQFWFAISLQLANQFVDKRMFRHKKRMQYNTFSLHVDLLYIASKSTLLWIKVRSTRLILTKIAFFFKKNTILAPGCRLQTFIMFVFPFDKELCMIEADCSNWFNSNSP